MTKIKLLLVTLSAAVAFAGGCKKSDDDRTSARPIENAGERVENAGERAADKTRDVAGEVRDEADRATDEVDRRVDGEGVKADLARTRDEFVAESKIRLAKIDQRISELRAKGDAKASAAADSLQTQRDKLQMRMDNASSIADDRWEEFKSDASTMFSDIEADLDARF